jgi:hypothetical protein
MIKKVITKNFKIWLRPKAPKPENQERSPLENVRAVKLPKAEDQRTRQSPSTEDKDADS